jgi:AcrR family transcriptional regulator
MDKKYTMSGRKKKKEMLDNLLKTEIVHAVLELVRSEYPVTMEEVAKRCGVAKGTLYNYFENKNALLAHVQVAVIEPILEIKNRIFEGEGSVLDRLFGFVDLVFDINDDVVAYMIFMQKIRTVAEDREETFNIAIKPLAELCREGIAEGIFPDVDPYILAETIFGTVISSLKSKVYRDKNPDEQEMKKDMVKIINMLVLKEKFI